MEAGSVFDDYRQYPTGKSIFNADNGVRVAILFYVICETAKVVICQDCLL
jgi:hypothetical protein